jgi:hypothetical protein
MKATHSFETSRSTHHDIPRTLIKFRNPLVQQLLVMSISFLTEGKFAVTVLRRETDWLIKPPMPVFGNCTTFIGSVGTCRFPKRIFLLPNRNISCYCFSVLIRMLLKARRNASYWQGLQELSFESYCYVSRNKYIGQNSCQL